MSKAADSYSFGVMLHEMASGQLVPRTRQNLLQCSVGHVLPMLKRAPPNSPPALASLLQSCLSSEPQGRPNFESIVTQLQAAVVQLANAGGGTSVAVMAPSSSPGATATGAAVSSPANKRSMETSPRTSGGGQGPAGAGPGGGGARASGPGATVNGQGLLGHQASRKSLREPSPLRAVSKPGDEGGQEAAGWWQQQAQRAQQALAPAGGPTMPAASGLQGQQVFVMSLDGPAQATPAAEPEPTVALPKPKLVIRRSVEMDVAPGGVAGAGGAGRTEAGGLQQAHQQQQQAQGQGVPGVSIGLGAGPSAHVDAQASGLYSTTSSVLACQGDMSMAGRCDDAHGVLMLSHAAPAPQEGDDFGSASAVAASAAPQQHQQQGGSQGRLNQVLLAGIEGLSTKGPESSAYPSTGGSDLQGAGRATKSPSSHGAAGAAGQAMGRSSSVAQQLSERAAAAAASETDTLSASALARVVAAGAGDSAALEGDGAGFVGALEEPLAAMGRRDGSVTAPATRMTPGSMAHAAGDVEPVALSHHATGNTGMPTGGAGSTSTSRQKKRGA